MLDVVRVRLMAVSAVRSYRVALVHGARCRAHDVVGRVAVRAAQAGIVMCVCRHACYVTAIRKPHAGVINLCEPGKTQRYASGARVAAEAPCVGDVRR